MLKIYGHAQSINVRKVLSRGQSWPYDLLPSEPAAPMPRLDTPTSSGTWRSCRSAPGSCGMVAMAVHERAG